MQEEESAVVVANAPHQTGFGGPCRGGEPLRPAYGKKLGKLPFYQTPKFIKLATKWHARLKREGFHDIEMPGSYVPTDFPIISGNKSCKIPEDSWDNPSAEYFYQATHWLTTGMASSSARERAVWRRHSDGQSTRKIAMALKLQRQAVWKIINTQRTQMLALMGHDDVG